MSGKKTMRDVLEAAMQDVALNGQAEIRVILNREYEALHAHLAHARECMQAVVDWHDNTWYSKRPHEPSCHCEVCNIRHCLAVTAEVSRVGGGGMENNKEKK